MPRKQDLSSRFFRSALPADPTWMRPLCAEKGLGAEAPIRELS
ncbi:hypothetical protein SynBIOSE41_03854 [Synechococcus sp. BIOS-E4-1]|nr:hypothetical protein SynBIOSE41_03854 [Synechococcus sp. BIOS-E4-1]